MNNFSRLIYGYLKEIKKRQWPYKEIMKKHHGEKNRKDFFEHRKKFYDTNFWNIQTMFQKTHFSS